MINYKNYPALLFTSYDKSNAPEELPFAMLDTEILKKVSVSKGFQNLFGFIAAKNSMKSETTNYYLSDQNFNEVEFNYNFRNQYFADFFMNYVTPKYGCVMFKDGGTYVYNLLGVNETKSLHKKEGRYMSVAFFKGDVFLGFEEAIINVVGLQKGLQVQETGIYTGGMDIGGYLSFCIITLAYARDKVHLLQSESVSEKIIKL